MSLVTIGGMRARFEEEVKVAQVAHIWADGASCTAFVVQNNILATAAHCVDNNPKFRPILFSNGFITQYTILAVGSLDLPGNDWALIGAPTEGIIPVNLAVGPVAWGTFVFTVGHSEASIVQLATPGIYFGDQGAMQVYAMKNYPGDSGSPIITDSGEVLGILVQAHSFAPAAFGTPIQKVIEAIAALEAGKSK